MDLGIDIGTSEVKVVLVDDAQRVVGQSSSALPITRPQPLWSEQDPHDWWTATVAALSRLRENHGQEFAALASTKESVAAVCAAPPVIDSYSPNPHRTEGLARRHLQFQRLYAALKPEMQAPPQQE